MTLLFGNARLSSADYAYVRNMDQQLVYSAAQKYIEMANLQMMDAWDLLVDPTPTSIVKERYKLGMTGRMQKVSELGTGAPVTLGGSWDVSYELHNFHEPTSVSDVDFAYMTAQELQLHVDGILTRARNAKRHEALYHLFNNTQKSFLDKRHGTLTIEPLANGDGVLYPPVEGSEVEAVDNHYLGSSYAAASIDDTNNPFVTIADELLEHGMNDMNDLPVGFLINTAQVPVVSALTNFIPVNPAAINAGADTDLVNLPPRNLPGKLIGYLLGYGWISAWKWIPAGYIVGVNSLNFMDIIRNLPGH
jgi:hypothetical protein